jgi:hypothetical protein
MKKIEQLNFTHEKKRAVKFQNRGDTMLKRGYYVKEGTTLKRVLCEEVKRNAKQIAPTLLKRGATILKSI